MHCTTHTRESRQVVALQSGCEDKASAIWHSGRVWGGGGGGWQGGCTFWKKKHVFMKIGKLNILSLNI